MADGWWRRLTESDSLPQFASILYLPRIPPRSRRVRDRLLRRLAGGLAVGAFVDRELEDRDLGPAPVEHALAVRQAAVHVQVAVADAVVAVRVVSVAVGVERAAETARGNLPAVR